MPPPIPSSASSCSASSSSSNSEDMQSPTHTTTSTPPPPNNNMTEEELTQTLQTELENLRAQTRQALETSWAEVERLQREGSESALRVLDLERELSALRNAAAVDDDDDEEDSEEEEESSEESKEDSDLMTSDDDDDDDDDDSDDDEEKEKMEVHDSDDSVGVVSSENRSVMDPEKLAAVAAAVAAQFGGESSNSEYDTGANGGGGGGGGRRRRSHRRPSYKGGGGGGSSSNPRRRTSRRRKSNSSRMLLGDSSITDKSYKPRRKSHSALSMQPPKPMENPKRRKSGGALEVGAALQQAAAGLVRVPSVSRRMSAFGRLQGEGENNAVDTPPRGRQSRHSSLPNNESYAYQQRHQHHHHHDDDPHQTAVRNDMISQLASLENDKRIMVEELESKLQSKEVAIETLENRTKLQEQTIQDLQVELEQMKSETEEKERIALLEMEHIKSEIEHNEAKTMDLERQVIVAERTLLQRQEKETSLQKEIIAIEERIQKTDEQSNTYITELEEKLKKSNASRLKYEEENDKMKQKTDEALQTLQHDLMTYLPKSNKGKELIEELMGEFENLREKEEMLSEVLVARMQERQETIAALERMGQVQKRVDGSMNSVNMMLLSFQENLEAMNLNSNDNDEEDGGGKDEDGKNGETDDNEEEDEGDDDNDDDVSSTAGVLHIATPTYSKSLTKAPSSSFSSPPDPATEAAMKRQEVAVAGLEKVMAVQEQVQEALKLVEEELMDRLASLDWNKSQGGGIGAAISVEGGNVVATAAAASASGGGGGGAGGGGWSRKSTSSAAAAGGMNDIMEKAEQIQDEAKEQLQEIHEEMSARLAEIEGYQNAQNGMFQGDGSDEGEGLGEGGRRRSSGVKLHQQQSAAEIDDEIQNDEDLDRLEAELEEKDANVAALQVATAEQEATVKDLRMQLETLQTNTKEESRASLEVMEKLQAEVRMIVERVAEKDRMIVSLTNVLNQRKTSEVELERELDRLKNEAKALETSFPEDLGHVGI